MKGFMRVTNSLCIFSGKPIQSLLFVAELHRMSLRIQFSMMDKNLLLPAEPISPLDFQGHCVII